MKNWRKQSDRILGKLWGNFLIFLGNFIYLFIYLFFLNLWIWHSKPLLRCADDNKLNLSKNCRLFLRKTCSDFEQNLDEFWRVLEIVWRNLEKIYWKFRWNFWENIDFSKTVWTLQYLWYCNENLLRRNYFWNSLRNAYRYFQSIQIIIFDVIREVNERKNKIDCG